MTKKNAQEDAEARKARQVLDRVHRDAEVVGQSSLVRAAGKARSHFAAEDADTDDKAELWGKRVARVLSVIAFIFLAIWLFNFLTR